MFFPARKNELFDLNIVKSIRGNVMEDYGKISLIEYINSISDVVYLSVNEMEVHFKVCRYLLKLKRIDTNSRIVEALLV